RFCARQPESRSCPRCLPLAEARTVVFDLHAKAITAAAGGDADVTGRLARRDPVADRVLDERLQQEVRHPRGQRLRGYVDRDVEAIGEAHLLYRHVLADEAGLVLERHLAGRVGVERRPEAVAYAAAHL